MLIKGSESGWWLKTQFSSCCMSPFSPFPCLAISSTQTHKVMQGVNNSELSEFWDASWFYESVLFYKSRQTFSNLDVFNIMGVVVSIKWFYAHKTSQRIWSWSIGNAKHARCLCFMSCVHDFRWQIMGLFWQGSPTDSCEMVFLFFPSDFLWIMLSIFLFL